MKLILSQIFNIELESERVKSESRYLFPSSAPQSLALTFSQSVRFLKEIPSQSNQTKRSYDPLIKRIE